MAPTLSITIDMQSNACVTVYTRNAPSLIYCNIAAQVTLINYRIVVLVQVVYLVFSREVSEKHERNEGGNTMVQSETGSRFTDEE